MLRKNGGGRDHQLFGARRMKTCFWWTGIQA
jgi:hypothetical protein